MALNGTGTTINLDGVYMPVCELQKIPYREVWYVIDPHGIMTVPAITWLASPHSIGRFLALALQGSETVASRQYYSEALRTLGIMPPLHVWFERKVERTRKLSGILTFSRGRVISSVDAS